MCETDHWQRPVFENTLLTINFFLVFFFCYFRNKHKSPRFFSQPKNGVFLWSSDSCDTLKKHTNFEDPKKSNKSSSFLNCSLISLFLFTFNSSQLISHQKYCFYLVFIHIFSQGPLLLFITHTLLNEFQDVLFLSDVISSVHSHCFNQSSFQKLWQFTCNFLQVSLAQIFSLSQSVDFFKFEIVQTFTTVNFLQEDFNLNIFITV